MSVVRVTRCEGVATVTVDNPPVNSIDAATLDGLEGAADELAVDAAVQAVILTSVVDKAFMAGADIDDFERALGDSSWIEQHTEQTRRMLGRWQSLPQPVIAAVPAPAVGGGLEVMLICDLVIADPTARFGVPEVRLGLIPGAGGTQRLPRRIPVALAREMVFLGETIDADRALAYGLINRVSAPGAALAEATALADRLATQSPDALRAAKRALAAAAQLPLDAGLDAERTIFLELFAGPDVREGITAFIEKRNPVFGG